MKFPALALVTAGLLSLGTAQAMIVNISAASPEPTVLALPGGTYAWSWIGTAQGGAFDGWSTAGTDSARWHGAFQLTVSYFGMSQTVVFDTYRPQGGFAVDGSYQYAAYATPGAALNAFQTGDFTVYSPRDHGEGGPYRLADMRIDVASTAMTLGFSLPAEFNASNVGGVSLSITAVPEPGTYTLMLAGIAVIAGLMLRRMRRDD